jgi:hypothetical protein
VVGGFLERVPSRQRQDLLVSSDEVGHPSNCQKLSYQQSD